MSRKFTEWAKLIRSDEHTSFMIGNDYALFDRSSQEDFWGIDRNYNQENWRMK